MNGWAGIKGTVVVIVHAIGSLDGVGFYVYKIPLLYILGQDWQDVCCSHGTVCHLGMSK